MGPCGRHGCRYCSGPRPTNVDPDHPGRPTQEYVVEQLGKAYIHSLSGTYTTHTDEHLGEYSGSVGTTLREVLEDTIPADVVGKLPTMQFFAAVSGGCLYKGRIPVLVPRAAPPAASRGRSRSSPRQSSCSG